MERSITRTPASARVHLRLHGTHTVRGRRRAESSASGNIFADGFPIPGPALTTLSLHARLSYRKSCTPQGPALPGPALGPCPAAHAGSRLAGGNVRWQRNGHSASAAGKGLLSPEGRQLYRSPFGAAGPLCGQRPRCRPVAGPARLPESGCPVLFRPWRTSSRRDLDD